MKKLTRAKLLGAFSQEVKDLISSRSRGLILNLCSGTWDFGITVDKITPADVTADVSHLPFKDACADTIIFDPPFGRKWKKLYGSYYADRRKVFGEIVRVLKPGGLLIFSHYFIPQQRIWQLEDVYMIVNQPWEHVRALSFSRRQNILFDIYNDQSLFQKHELLEEIKPELKNPTPDQIRRPGPQNPSAAHEKIQPRSQKPIPCSSGPCRFYRPPDFCASLPWNDTTLPTAYEKYIAWKGQPCQANNEEVTH